MAGCSVRCRTVCVLIGAWLLLGSTAHAQGRAGPGSDLVGRGEYLARASDCGPCHTVPGRPAFTGGRAFKLPFGTLYTPNITPDRETGIGTYTDDEFVAALRDGVGRGGKHLYPAMPYTSYVGMSREDALAIKAYLFSLAPVQAAAPDNTLEFPFNQRAGLIAWKLLFHKGGQVEPETGRTADWNRGAYLVKALGHCGECHSPRGLAQNVEVGRSLSGGQADGWTAYNITADAHSGVGAWSDEALTSYLSTGHGPGHSAAAGPMAEVVEHSLRFLTPDDTRAMVTYLRTVPAIRTGPAAAAAPPQPGNADALGKRVFAGACANCHLPDGTGAQSPYADLAGSRSVNEPDARNLIAVLLEGAHMRTAHANVAMPAFAAYADDELAAVANHLSAEFGNGATQVTAGDVARARPAAPKPFWPAWTAPALTGLVIMAGAALMLAAVWLNRRRRLTSA